MRPLRIFTVDTRVPVLEKAEFLTLASQRDLQDLKVVVLSIVGPECETKRLTLNSILRYLKHRSEQQPGHWSEYNHDFDYVNWTSSGTDRTEVLIWGEVFKIRIASGERVAVILMSANDTLETELVIVKETTVLAFSILSSSVQIYSLANGIEEADITHLDLFTKFGLLAAKENARRGLVPFQRLVFLVHNFPTNFDWSSGWKSADNLLMSARRAEGTTTDVGVLRTNIRRCFDDIYCYVIKERDLGVKAEVDGHNGGYDAVFIERLRSFVDTVLSPENLLPKKINGREITFRDFCFCVQTYAEIISGMIIPGPRVLFEAMVETNNYMVYKRTLEVYFAGMAQLFRQPDRFVPWHEFRRHCRKCLDDSEAYLRTAYKMGKKTVQKHLRYRTLKNLEYMYRDFHAGNCRAELLLKLRDSHEQQARLWSLLEKQISLGSVSNALLQELNGTEKVSATLQAQINNLTLEIETRGRGLWAHDESSLQLRVFRNTSDTSNDSDNSSSADGQQDTVSAS